MKALVTTNTVVDDDTTQSDRRDSWNVVTLPRWLNSQRTEEDAYCSSVGTTQRPWTDKTLASLHPGSWNNIYIRKAQGLKNGQTLANHWPVLVRRQQN